MKCPKCGYLGFETTERCRHCGYDFSLCVAVDPDATETLSLRDRVEAEAPLGDFDLRDLRTEREPHTVETSAAVATPPSLPLFTSGQKTSNAPVAPLPARPPLAVRRATPEVPRRRTPRPMRHDVEEISLHLEPAALAPPETSQIDDADVRHSASAVRRVAAASVDAVILGGISAAVVYLTLAITGLSLSEWRSVPPVPMAAFLLLLNSGYLVGFTATNGQTIGKMTARIRVIADDGERVGIARAVLRAAVVLASAAFAGLPYLPALVSDDGRALHDRLAGTRVVRSA